MGAPRQPSSSAWLTKPGPPVRTVVLEALVTEGSVDLLVPALGVLSLQPQRLPRAIPQSVARSVGVAEMGKGPATRRCRRAHPGRYQKSPPGLRHLRRRCMPTMARSMTHFGLLMIWSHFHEMLLRCVTLGRDAHKSNSSIHFVETARYQSKSTARCRLYAAPAFLLARRI
jgi:hypothetical protein